MPYFTITYAPTAPYFTEAVNRRYAANWVRLGRVTLPRAVIYNSAVLERSPLGSPCRGAVTPSLRDRGALNPFGLTATSPKRGSEGRSALMLSVAKDPIERTGVHKRRHAENVSRTKSTEALSKQLAACFTDLRHEILTSRQGSRAALRHK